MNNLILAVIAIAFTTALIAAGISYVPPTAAITKTQITNSVADIEHIVTDYQNLSINLGRRPAIDDYAAVYGAESANSSYQYPSGAATAPVRASSIPGTGSWSYQASTGADYFCLDVPSTGSGPTAKLAFDAVYGAAKRELTTSGSSRIAYNPQTCATTQSTGNWSAALNNVSAWPVSTEGPSTPYSLLIQLSGAGETCTVSGINHPASSTWSTTTSAAGGSCPAGTYGPAGLLLTTTYVCSAGAIPQAISTSQALDPSGCSVFVTLPAYSGSCDSSCGPGSYDLTSWTCGPTGHEYNQSQCQAMGVPAPAATNGSCVGTNGCQTNPSYGTTCSNSCGTGTLALNGWTCGPSGNINEFSSSQCSSWGVSVPSQSCSASTGCASCGAAAGVASASLPATNLCSTGSVTHGASQQGSWTWGCISSDGTNTASCSAPQLANAACGSLNYGPATLTAPWGASASSLCSSGTPTNETVANGYWTWSCNNGVGASCYEALPTAWWGTGWTGYACGTVKLTSTGVACEDGGGNQYPGNYCFGAAPASVTTMYEDTDACASCGTASSSIDTVAPWIDNYSNLCATGFAANGSISSNNWTWNCVSRDKTTTVACTERDGVDGICGSAAGTTPYATAPWTANASGLCAGGTAASEVLSAGKWSWSCTGTYAGKTATCTAPVQTLWSANSGWTGYACGSVTLTSTAVKCMDSSGNVYADSACTGTKPASVTTPYTDTTTCAVCGTAQGAASLLAPWISNSANLCSTGTVVASSETAGPNSWSWGCASSDKLYTASCSAPVLPNLCGSANGATASILPPWTVLPLNLCLNATVGPETVSAGLWKWSCTSGTNTTSCSQALPTSWQASAWTGYACGTVKLTGSTVSCEDANGTIYADSYCAGTKPAASTFTKTVVDTDASVCAVATCGTANTVSTLVAPWSNNASHLCSAGSVVASSETSTGSLWSWTCLSPNGTVSASCSAPELANLCGSASGSAASATPPWIANAANLCSGGTAGTETNTSTAWTWKCTSGSNTTSCSENLLTPCGTSNGAAATMTAPWSNSAGLCSAGTPSAETVTSGSWTWTCTSGTYAKACSERLATSWQGTAWTGYACGTVTLTATAISCEDANGTVYADSYCTTKPAASTITKTIVDSDASVCGVASCGAAANVIDASAPWSNKASTLCASGTAGSEALVNTTYKWNCVSGDHSVTVPCVAPQSGATAWWVTGWSGYACGTVTLTATGLACEDASGNIYPDSQCSTPKPALSAYTEVYDDTNDCAGCGSAANTASVTAPWVDNYTNLCASGFASAHTNNGNSWGWTCVSQSGTGTTSCSAPQVVNGACGAANGAAPAVTAPWIGTPGILCTSGAVSSEATGNGAFTWACSGSNNGTTATCAQDIAVGWSSSTWTGYACGNVTLTSTNVQCMDSLATVYPDSHCNGPKPASVSKAYTDTESCAACGSATSSTSATPPWSTNFSNLCSSGASTADTNTSTTWGWSCVSADSRTTVACTEPKVVNGACGSANGVSDTTAPWADGSVPCSTGLPDVEVVSATQWSWSCDGANGGAAATCTAPRPVTH